VSSSFLIVIRYRDTSGFSSQESYTTIHKNQWHFSKACTQGTCA
jgi:hypothetical protein